MDYFETIVARVLEEDGYWVRRGVRANLSKADKVRLGKPSLPRPEVDLVAYKARSNELVFFEVKSYLDSPGVKVAMLEQADEWESSNRYKLLTLKDYQRVVTATICKEYVAQGLIRPKPKIRFGLAIGNAPNGELPAIKKLAAKHGWVYLAPDQIRKSIQRLASGPYENSPIVVTAKVLARKN